MSDPKIIVALDYSDVRLALELVARLEPALCRLKVGMELFTTAGPGLVEQLMKQGFDVFLDLKFHDIPNTAVQACKAAAALGVWMVNVHALGGRKMMEAVREGISVHSHAPKLIAVTILTSMAQEDLVDLGVNCTPADMVMRLARLAQESGLDGVVCSAHEAARLRRQCGIKFCLVTPGIRSTDDGSDDQSRIMMPRAALDQGANYLVVGRPITRAIDPLQALLNMVKQIGEA